MASAYSLAYGLQSADNKSQFMGIWDVVKAIPKASRVAEIKLMKKASEETIKLNSARREYKSLLTAVENYAQLPDRHINLTMVSYENLRRAIGLVSRVVKHYDGDMTKLTKLSEVYKSGRSAHNYNNEYEDACKKLAEQLPAVVDAKVYTPEEVLLYADKLDVTAKTALFERLLHDLGYSMSEVA